MSKDSGSNFGKLLLLGVGLGLGWMFKKDPTPRKLLERDGLKYLSKVIKEWRPIECKSEKDYQRSLKQYFLGRFSEDRLSVESEYGFGRSRADIVIENDYGIELKYNLSNESDIKRMRSQMDEMKSAFVGSILLLCGSVGEDVLNRLKSELPEEDENGETICDVLRIPSNLP